jgi:hypothetical protein
MENNSYGTESIPERNMARFNKVWELLVHEDDEPIPWHNGKVYLYTNNIEVDDDRNTNPVIIAAQIGTHVEREVLM